MDERVRIDIQKNRSRQRTDRYKKTSNRFDPATRGLYFITSAR